MVVFVFSLVVCFLFAIYGALIAWYQKAWNALPFYMPRGNNPPRTRITVLVPARNEEDNIGNCLEALAAQTYASGFFEVIVIDDHSTDNTAALVEAFARTGRINLRLLSLASALGNGPVTAHKKRAIEAGVGQAKGELIVTTDADCTFHPDWIATLAGFYQATGAKFIAAPVRIGAAVQVPNRSNLTFLAIFQTLDFITLQGITGAAVAQRAHSMCNGANLAYEKKAFHEVGGFKGIDSIPSGDDMLLMHKIYLAYPEKVFFLKSREAIVSTAPMTTWKGFVNQRIRWASKADSYDDKRIFYILLFVYGVNLLFPLLLIAAFWNSWWLWLAFIGLLLKTVVEYPFVRSVASFFEQQKLMVYFPFLQPFHVAYTLTIGWLGKFGSYRWKDRKISK